MKTCKYFTDSAGRLERDRAARWLMRFLLLRRCLWEKRHAARASDLVLYSGHPTLEIGRMEWKSKKTKPLRSATQNPRFSRDGSCDWDFGEEEFLDVGPRLSVSCCRLLRSVDSSRFVVNWKFIKCHSHYSFRAVVGFAVVGLLFRFAVSVAEICRFE